MAKVVRMTGARGHVEVFGGRDDDLADVLASAREAWDALGEDAPETGAPDGLRPLPNPLNWQPMTLGQLGFRVDEK